MYKGSNKTEVTLKKLLEEAKNEITKIEKGQFLEVLKTIYPNETILSEHKNVTKDDIRITLPLAMSSKAKKEFERQDSFLKEFSKDTTRGDFLEVLEIKGNTAFCINKSLKEDILNKYYNNKSMKIIEIKLENVLNGEVRKVYRGFKKYI